MKKIAAALACAALGAVVNSPGPAMAEHLLTTVFAPVQLFQAQGPLAIFPSGSFSQSIFLNTASTVMFSFTAVCSTSGAGFSFTSIQFLVDGIKRYPTNQSGNVFCSSGGNAAATDAISTNSFISTAVLPAGNHNINVNAVPSPGATSRIKNLSIVVWR